MAKVTYSERKCKHHGLTSYVKRQDGKLRCRACARDGVIKTRKNKKKKLVDHFGGCCVRCGYNKCIQALHFHHRNPEEKEFGIARTGKSFKACVKEAEKCDLVCSNCHAEAHVL